MENWDMNPGKLPPSPADPVDKHEKVYAAIRAAISAGNLSEAHRLLHTLIEADGKNPELWLLLSWTAPDSNSAEWFFKELLQRQPDYPLAMCGVPWSGKEWGTQAGEQPGSRILARLSSLPAVNDSQPAIKDEGVPVTNKPAKDILYPDMYPDWYRITPASGDSQPQSTLPDWSESISASLDDPSTNLILDWPESNQTIKDNQAASPPADWPESIPIIKDSQAPHAPTDWPEEAAPPKDSQSHKRHAEWFEPAAWAIDRGPTIGPFQNKGRSGSGRQGVQLAEFSHRISFPLFMALYLLGIASAELVTLTINPRSGVIIHAILLGLILVHALLEARSSKHKFLLALGLVPLIRLLSILTALPQFDLIPRYLVIGIPMLLASVAVYRRSGYKPGQIGLARGKWLPLQLAVGLAGVGLGYLEYLILKPQPLVEGFTLGSIWPTAFILLVFPSFLEELIFRGLLQRASAGSLNKIGPWYIALLFALLHINTNSWVAVTLAAMVGIAFSFIAARTRSLIGVTLAHGLANISLFLVFPFLLAAPLQAEPASPTAIHMYGPPIWSAPLSQAANLMYVPAGTATSTMTALPLPFTPTGTPSATPSATRTLTHTPYWSPTASGTITPSPTSTISPTPSPTASATPTKTSTRTLGPTRTPTEPPELTDTPTPSLEPSPTLFPTDPLPDEPTPTP
jgi:membrane protease YdiL (CAAX protease family)